jgi:GMP synthase (glutamine-hydrolysing)
MNEILHTTHPDSILIIDFGSQVTQLIARRVREAGVYCEIVPFQLADDGFARMKPKGVIFSGGPAFGHPRRLAARTAGACSISACRFSPSATASRRCVSKDGGQVEGGPTTANSAGPLSRSSNPPLFEGFWEVGKKYPVWMSHGDRVTVLCPKVSR